MSRATCQRKVGLKRAWKCLILGTALIFAVTMGHKGIARDLIKARCQCACVIARF